MASDRETFIDISEELVDELADFCDQYIDEIINRLMPDGRPFGMEKQSIKEEIRDYMQLRGNAAKWWDWLADRIEYIEQKKQEMLTPEQQKQVSSVDIVFRYALNYSAKMERAMKRYALSADDIMNKAETVKIEIDPIMTEDLEEGF